MVLLIENSHACTQSLADGYALEEEGERQDGHNVAPATPTCVSVILLITKKSHAPVRTH